MPLVMCSGILHSLIQARNYLHSASGAPITSVRRKISCHLVAISGNNNVKTPVSGNFKLTRTVELEMTPALKDWPEVGHRITI